MGEVVLGVGFLVAAAWMTFGSREPVDDSGDTTRRRWGNRYYEWSIFRVLPATFVLAGVVMIGKGIADLLG